jgi:hypothetical protein
MILPSSSLIKLVLVFVMFVLVAGGLYYVTGLRANLVVAEENKQTLLTAVTDQQAVLNKIRDDFAVQQNINQQLTESVRRNQQDLTDLNNKFNINARDQRRDVGALAAKRPAAIERLANRGSSNAIRCLELASGAELNEKEKNATTSKDLNPECPGLARTIVPSFAQ